MNDVPTQTTAVSPALDAGGPSVRPAARPAHAPPDPSVGSAPGWPLVLYYHHVHPDIDHYTNLTPEAFAHGLDLVLEKFEPLDPFWLQEPWGTPPPDRPTVLITFDDGYRDLARYAVPVLDQRAVRSVFFVCTRLLGRRGDDPRADHLDWTQCAALHGSGHLIASHGLTHTPLDLLTGDEIRVEVLESLSELGDLLGLRQAVYAYPYGIQAPLPERAPGMGPMIAFGSVKATAAPWSAAPTGIRRTYLPSDTPRRWADLVAGWHAQWYSGRR